MTRHPDLATADDLRTWTAERWQEFVATTDALAPDEWESLTDVAGWSVKDHVAHVTRWDQSLIALVRDGTPRQQTLSVSDDAWRAGGYDAMNEAIRQQTSDIPVAEIVSQRDATWSELAGLLATYDDATLQRPGKEFGLAYGPNDTFLETLIDDLGVHYDQHRQYVERIVRTARMTDPAEYLVLADQRWNELTRFLDALTPEEWIAFTDAHGWTVKDHVSHVIDWDDAWISQATGRERQRTRLAVPDAIWDQGVDAINAFLRERSLSLSVPDVRDRLTEQIEAARSALDTVDLRQEARALGLARPDDDRTTLRAFIDDQAEHVEQHHRYMDRIVDEGRAQQSEAGT